MCLAVSFDAFRTVFGTGSLVVSGAIFWDVSGAISGAVWAVMPTVETMVECELNAVEKQ